MAETEPGNGAQQDGRVPVTVLSGFLGAGKTTLLSRLLRENGGLRIGAVVNDMAELNVDAETIREGPHGPLATLENGCICCTKRDDFWEEIAEMSKGDQLDAIVVEASGISDPIGIAVSWGAQQRGAKRVQKGSRLDLLVTVVDGQNFSKQFNSRGLAGKDGEMCSPGAKHISELLAEQIEVANVIVVSKADLATSEELNQAEEVVTKLNPGAKVILSAKGEVPPELLLRTGIFDLQSEAARPRWVRELAIDHQSEVDEYGVSCFVYRDRQPFDPKKFYAVLGNPKLVQNVIRIKGLFWPSCDLTHRYTINFAGRVMGFGANGVWAAAFAGAHPEEAHRVQGVLEKHGEGIYGDRRQEMVFIGRGMDDGQIKSLLDGCLVDLGELTDGQWSTIDNPFF